MIEGRHRPEPTPRLQLERLAFARLTKRELFNRDTSKLGELLHRFADRDEGGDRLEWLEVEQFLHLWLGRWR